MGTWGHCMINRIYLSFFFCIENNFLNFLHERDMGHRMIGRIYLIVFIFD